MYFSHYLQMTLGFSSLYCPGHSCPLVQSPAFWMLKLPPVPAASVDAAQGHARPKDGALGLFTLRHTITERWIRSYLRSAFSQRSLATEPPRYKYTPETCAASSSKLRPAGPWGRYRQEARTSGEAQGKEERQPHCCKVKHSTHQIKCL